MSSVLSMVGLRELCDIQVGMSKKIIHKGLDPGVGVLGTEQFSGRRRSH